MNEEQLESLGNCHDPCTVDDPLTRLVPGRMTIKSLTVFMGLCTAAANAHLVRR